MKPQQRILRFFAITTLFAIAVTACSGTSTATSGQILLVSPTEAARLMEDPIRSPFRLLDVRTPEEFADVRIAETHLNHDFYESDFRDQLDKLHKDSPYVVYCRSGNRSAEAVRIMRELGFRQVWEVDGGILSWIEAGLPVETGPPL